jgi:hypothetical protein
LAIDDINMAYWPIGAIFVTTTPDGHFITNITLVDVDPDKKAVLDCYRELFNFRIPDIDLIHTAPWAVADRKFFFDHPTEDQYVRDCDPEERIDILEAITRSGVTAGSDVEDPGYCKKILVAGVIPGVRCRFSVDRKDRKLRKVVIPTPVVPFGLAMVPATDYLDRLVHLWTHAAQQHYEDSKPKEK